MGTFGTSMRRVLAMVALIAGTVAVMASASAGAQGNSDAAHACQKGGYANLQGVDGTLFANVGECVSYAAHGGTLIAIPTATSVPTATEVPTEMPTEVPTAVPTATPAQSLTVSFTPTGDPDYCSVIVTLVSFPANASIPVTLTFSDNTGMPYDRTMTTDAFGYASGAPVGSYYNGGVSVDVTASGFDSGWVPIGC